MVLNSGYRRWCLLLEMDDIGGMWIVAVGVNVVGLKR